MINFNNGTITFNSHWLKPSKLPPFTLRLLYADGHIPKGLPGSYGIDWYNSPYPEFKQISVSPNIWDITYVYPDWSFLSNNNAANNASLLEVIDANTTGVRSMRGLFSGCTELRKVCPLDTSTVHWMDSMFANTESLSEIPWIDTSNVLSMCAMFQSSGIVTIPQLDTHNCHVFGEMFWRCPNLEYIPWIDTSLAGVTGDYYTDSHVSWYRHEIYGMFYNTPKLKTIPLIDTSHVRNFTYMFEESGIEYMPLIDTSSGEEFTAMFYKAQNLKNVPDFDMSSLKNQSGYSRVWTDGMFYLCTNVQGGAYNLYRKMEAVANANGWDPTSTFYYCGKNTIPGQSELSMIPSAWGGEYYPTWINIIDYPCYNSGSIIYSPAGSTDANPRSGYPGTEVVLTSTPNNGYEFDSYIVSGTNSVSGNTFIIENDPIAVTAVYKFTEVTIGNQTWMDTNLAFTDNGSDISRQRVSYDGGSTYVYEYYYTWEAAKRIANMFPGWRLPTRQEYGDLYFNLPGISWADAGTALKSTYGWTPDQYGDTNGTDDFGFTGLPAGYYDNGTFGNFGTEFRFWTSDYFDDSLAYYGLLNQSETPQIQNMSNTNKCSVRLIKDT